MTNAKTWQDIFYETTAEELVYSVRYLGNDIFYGRAVKSPSAATLRINVSKICRDWVEAQVPSFNDGVYQGINYGVFDLVSDEGTVLSQYGFLFNWDYEDVWDGQSFVMSKPINGRADSRMKLMYSVFSDTAGQTVCRDEEFIKKLRIIPSYFEVGNSGVTRTIQVDANYSYNVTNNNSWIHISPTSGSSGITVFTITVDNNALSEDRDGNVYFDNSILTIAQREAPMLLEVEPTSISSPYGGGSYPINFTANTNFSLTTESHWITTSVSAGTPGTGFFTLYVAPNTSTNVRNGYLRVGRVRVNVVQEAVVANISVSPTSLSYGYTGGNKSITITSNCDYNITTNSPWITLSASSGTSGVTTITVNASMNTGTSARSGKIYIGDKEVSLYQEYNEYVNIYPTSIYAESGGGVYVVSVSSNTSYNISASSDWVSVNKTSGSGNGTVNITIAGNSTNYQRTALVTIGGKNVSITQFAQGESPYVVVSPESISATLTGGTYTISVSSNTNYEISANEPWIILSASSGTGNSTITVTIDANSGITRNAQINVGGNIIPVSQGGSGSAIMYTYGSLGNASKVPKTDTKWGDANVIALVRDNGVGTIYFDEAPTETPIQAFSYYGFSGRQDITSVNLPDSITYIGQESFNGNANLTGITLPNAVSVIDSLAFANCRSLTYVPLPANLTEIRHWAFRDNVSLTSVVIPDSVQYIEQGAYTRCNGITSVTIGSGVKRCAGAFRGCTSLPEYGYMTYADTLAVRATDFTRETYTLKPGTKYIGNYHYYSSLDNFGTTFCELDDSDAINTYLLYMTLPDTLIEIGDYTFDGCRALSSVTIPSSVEYIGSGAFFGTALTELNFNGTMSQWNNIDKPTDPYNTWNYGSGISVIHCTDGDITIE